MFETLETLSAANVVEYYLSELPTMNCSVESYLKSFMSSESGMIIFNPPEKSYIPEDLAKVGVEAPSFKLNSGIDILEKTSVPCVENNSVSVLDLPGRFLVGAGLGSIFYIIVTSISELANDAPPASPSGASGSGQGESTSQQVTTSGRSEGFIIPANIGGGGGAGGDDGENPRRFLSFEVSSDLPFSVEDLVKELQRIIEGLVLNISCELMSTLFGNYQQLNRDENPGFTMIQCSRNLTRRRDEIWDITVIGRQGFSPRVFTRKQSSQDPYSLLTNARNIARLQRLINAPSGLVSQSDLLSNDSIESITPPASSRRARASSPAGSATSAVSRSSFHTHSHFHEGPRQFNPQEGHSSGSYNPHQAYLEESRRMAISQYESKLQLEDESRAHERRQIAAQQKSVVAKTDPVPQPDKPSEPKDGSITKTTQDKDSSLWLKASLGLGALSIGLIGGGVYAGRRRQKRNNQLGMTRGRQDFASGITGINNEYKWWLRAPWDHEKMPRPSGGNSCIQPYSNKIEESTDFRRGRYRTFEVAQNNYVRKHPRHSVRAGSLSSPEDETCLDQSGEIHITPEVIMKLVGILTSILSGLGVSTNIISRRRSS